MKRLGDSHIRNPQDRDDIFDFNALLAIGKLLCKKRDSYTP